jgi:hypothetical protein
MLSNLTTLITQIFWIFFKERLKTKPTNILANNNAEILKVLLLALALLLIILWRTGLSIDDLIRDEQSCRKKAISRC